MNDRKMSIPSSRVGSATRRRNPMYGLNHKALREEAIVRKREITRMKNEFWDSTSKYFDRLSMQNERFEVWNSDEMAKKSEEAFRKAKMAETRRSNLLGRRTKLRNKLEAEESRDLANIRKIPVGTQKSLKSVREEYEKMKVKRMEEQQKEAEEKMLQHWRINNPEYRQVQCQKRYEMVQKAWDEQRIEKEKAEDAEKRAEEIRIRVEAEKTLRKESEEKEAQREKERQIQAWKEVIVQQIGALKERRGEEEKAKRLLAEEQERAKKMEEVAMKRKKIEDKRKMQDLREFLSRQHRLKLLAKTSQIQKDLEEDKRLLEEVTAFSQVQNEQEIKEREEKNQRLTWLKEVIDLQKAEEAKRQKQMEMLFSEEAEKMWNKQEAVWQKEAEARKHLMDDVLDGLKEQIRVKVQGIVKWNYFLFAPFSIPFFLSFCLHRKRP